MAKILVVDDNAINREFLLTLLGYFNHEILEATNGAQALKIAEDERPDLIITDLLMPVMDGYELTKQLRKNPALEKIPIIFHTATYRVLDASVIAVTLGVKYVLSKPCDPKVIIETVNKALKTTSPIPEKDIQSDIRVSEASLSSRLSAFLELKINLSALKNPEELFTAFCKGALRIQAVENCGLGIAKENNSVFSYYVASMNNKSVTKHKMDMSLTSNDLIGQLLMNKKILTINNVQDHPEIKSIPHSIQRSLLAIPVTTTPYYGFLYFCDKVDKTDFKDVDIEIGTALATEIGNLSQKIEQTLSH